MRLPLKLFTEPTFITVELYRGVKNAAEIRSKLAHLNCAVIKADLVVDPRQIVFAATKALYLKRSGEMRTRTVYTELLYRLSPSTNVNLPSMISLIGYRDVENLWNRRR